MLLRFRFSNFRSFRDEQELSLVASDAAGGFAFPGLKEAVLPACAIYGANASGKSNVLKALAFVRQAVLQSQRLWEPEGPIPVQAFRGSSGDLGGEFCIDFVAEGVRYEFGFRATAKEMTKEWLLGYPNAKKQVLYERSEPSSITFGRGLSGSNKTIAGLMRRNSLFLSAAAQNNHEALRHIYGWFQNSLHFVFEKIAAFEFERMSKEDRWQDDATDLMTFADLGIADFRVEKRQAPDSSDIPDAAKSAMDSVKAALGSLLKALNIPEELPDDTETVTFLHHLGGRLVPFDIADESAGTVAWFSLLGPVLTALETGTILVIDELDASLHPSLSTFLVGLFTNKTTNPKSAQLIFNTHNTNLLSDGVLRRDQIWFTEKDRQGVSHLYPLTDFKPRAEDNLQKRYLQGRFGAIPFIDTERIIDGLRAHESPK